MNHEIIEQLSKTLKKDIKQIEETLKMLEEGATVPFIARYRKERTGGLNEDEIRAISKEYEYSVNLAKRKEDVIRLIDEKGLLTEELKENILKAEKLSNVEDYYRPYKEKKKTKATIAISKGLKPLAELILTCPREGSISLVTKPYINDEVKTEEEAIQGAKDIIAETISDDIKFRQYTKSFLYKVGVLKTKLKKNANDEKHLYEMYYDYEEKLKNIANHRLLAINRAEKEKILNVSIQFDKEPFIEYIYRGIVWKKVSFVNDLIHEAVIDSFDRLLYPSIEREIISELLDKAEVDSLKVFSLNLEHLLMQPPLKGKYILGLDPGFRTGCKLAAVDPTGKVLGIDKCYISIPKKDYKQDEQTLLKMIQDYHIEVIAMGNGTASRESEAFIAKFIQKYQLDVQYVIVSEAGASVYSASKIAKEEFPDYQVEERSAVSIARRLQDPLAELVKIDPKSISVGQYQHDMNQKSLGEQLDFTVEKVVNQVGVNINTASPSLLQYVSGLNATTAKNIVKYREENGKFTNRKQILKVNKLGPKTYEQAVGFLRILNGENSLDQTSIHPDNYEDALKLLDYLNLHVDDIGTSKMKEKIDSVNKQAIMTELGFSNYLVDDLLGSFITPLRTPRDDYEAPKLKSNILTLQDLNEGLILEGTIRNVVDFGAFVDIGLHEDGLIHISKLSTKRINHPLDVVQVGDIVEVEVIDIDEKRQRVGLKLVKKS